jgi:acyl-CoA reductase-like NAD-dependent aldehyde dehydrogenase
VLKNINDAKSRGATVLAGGVANGPCVEPTLLENVPTDHVLCTEEAFAPVAVLVAYDDFDDAIALANASNFGLQAGVYTRDITWAFAAFERLDVGGVLINQPPTMRIDNLPYGGVKDSGFGREGIDFAIEDMTEPRVMIVKL